MYLSDKDLKIIAFKHKLVEPFVEGNCEGATINITLDSQIKKYVSKDKHIIVNKPPESDYETIDINKEEFLLNPNESILVQSYEYFRIPNNMIAIILERYSVKLLGLVVSPASYMNPGYEGRLSFLMTNHSNSPIQLISGVKFCQMAVAELSTESEKPYIKQDAKYMGSYNVHTSKLHLDKEIQGYLKEKGLGEVSDVEARQMGSHILSEMDKNAERYVEIIGEKLGGFNEPTT